MSDLLAGFEAELGSAAVGVEQLAGWDREVPVVAPASEAEVVAVIRRAAAGGLRLIPVGNGSKLAWSAAPERLDLALTTRRLAGEIEYEPGDGTVTASAGTTMAALARTVRAGGHHLTPDVPAPATVTLGGVVAAGQSGVDRLRHGPVRHHVLGLTVATADGAVTRCGGRLVKNVTGFDLQRLYTGSRGSLCVILQASLRLFPLPGARATLSWEAADRAAAHERCRELLARLWQPLAVAWREDVPADTRVHVALAGRPEHVEADLEVARAILPGAEIARDASAEAALDALRDAACTDGQWPLLQLAVRPSRLATTLAAAERALGRDLGLLVHPGLASAELWPRTVPGAAEIAALREHLAPLGARLVARGALLATGIEPFGAAGPGAALARRVRAALDPDGLFAAGEPAGGLA